ncbi:MAG: zinc ribbon domain-containing protein [Chloroflexota bacterium]
MPTYEYECAECGEKFEIRRGIFSKAADKPQCPKCKSERTRRVISAPAESRQSGYHAPRRFG